MSLVEFWIIVSLTTFPTSPVALVVQFCRVLWEHIYCVVTELTVTSIFATAQITDVMN